MHSCVFTLLVKGFRAHYEAAYLPSQIDCRIKVIECYVVVCFTLKASLKSGLQAPGAEVGGIERSHTALDAIIDAFGLVSISM